MEKLTLELLFQIIGIGSASGLIYKDQKLLIIGDNSGYLYEYSIPSHELKRFPLLENPLENTPKKDKADFEAITLHSNNVYVFGSGSTQKRNLMIQLDYTNKEVIKSHDLTALYNTLQSFGDIKPEDFNLEGAIYNGSTWYLINRGNGNAKKNSVFTIEGENLTDNFSLLSNDYKLPKINGVKSSFTDAILVDDSIYFLASAEDTNSTYDDGEVLGSVLGKINIATMKIEFTKQISEIHKFEGLTLFTNSPEKIEFLLCEDKDTDVLETDIYKVSLNKK